MNKWTKNLGLVTVIIMMLFLVACTSSVEDELKQAVEDNFKAMNEKNMDAYMSMLSKETDPAVVTQTEKTMKYSFENFDLHASLKRFKLVSESGNTAVIEVEQDTINKKEDARFKNNRVIAEHTMIKEDNTWKFKSSFIRSAKELDSSGNVVGELQ